jgi:hypothetical protein
MSSSEINGLFKIKEKNMKKQTFLIHVDMGKIGRCIKAASKEEAVRIATDWATRMITKRTCSHIQPRVISVD